MTIFDSPARNPDTSPRPTAKERRNDAPLANYRIVGMTERWYQPPIPSAPKQPAGSCWHCSTGIAYCVVIRNSHTGEEHELGTTCAERVGLDKAELKAFLAEKFADIRAADREARRAANWWRQTRQEDIRTHWFGAHGTESRWMTGCHCRPCRKVASHGSLDRFFDGRCRCLCCIDAVLADDRHRYRIKTIDVIVSLSTGQVVDARKVNTTYGARWCIQDATTWLPIRPARRSTHANKGYVQATAPWLVEECESRTRDSWGTRYWDRPVCPAGSPLVDNWGERIPPPEEVQ